MTPAFEAWLYHAGYAGIFVATLLSNLGIPAVGSFALLLSLPFLISPEWWIVALISIAGETVGQSIQFSLARFGAVSFASHLHRHTAAGTPLANRFERFYRRYGNLAVLLCRFVPGVKALAGFPAGAARMPLLAFLCYTLAGTTISCFCLDWFLHAAGRHSQRAGGYFRQHGFQVAGALLACLLIAGLIRLARRKRI